MSTHAPAGFIPAQQQPDGAAGIPNNKPDNAAACAPHQQPPPCNESKTFYPAENKPGELDTNKAYGTFKSAPPPPVPGSAAVNSDFRKDSVGSARGDPLRATAEQNNTVGNWTAMSQTTIILGADGNTSVQPGAVTGVRMQMSRVGLPRVAPKPWRHRAADQSMCVIYIFIYLV